MKKQIREDLGSIISIISLPIAVGVMLHGCITNFKDFKEEMKRIPKKEYNLQINKEHDLFLKNNSYLKINDSTYIPYKEFNSKNLEQIYLKNKYVKKESMGGN